MDWLTGVGVWFVVWMAVPIGIGMYPMSKLTLSTKGWRVTRGVWYSLCVWYICMVGVVFMGGNTWIGWMLSILYLIGLLTVVVLATGGRRKPGPHPPQTMGTPIPTLDEDEIRQARQNLQRTRARIQRAAT